jgi:UDPglucose 6-dehydrogenase
MAVKGGREPRLAVIGLGKLGAPMAAVFAAKGFEVVGVDLTQANVDAVNEGRAPVDEAQLQEFIDRSRGRLRATADFADAIAASDISFVIVPTPSGRDDFFVNDYVIDAVTRIGAVLRQTQHDHLVVITSTVMPGSTDGVIRDALEQSSGRTVGVDVGLCYSPEFIALGSVVRDLLNPDMVLIGECSEEYGALLERVYRATTESDPSVQRMAFVNAEICKIAVNTFVTTKISYANMLADLCDHLPGADVDAITGALGADTRIGPKYLRGAVAYGGPCFPRDNKAFAALARTLGVPFGIAEATDQINDYQVERLLGAVSATVSRGGRVAVLGLSYKTGTGVFEKSQGLALARALMGEGYRVALADPQSAEGAAAVLGRDVEAFAEFAPAIASCDAAVITTPWPAIREVPASAFQRASGPVPVIDPWGLLKDTPLAKVARLISLGRGAAPAAARHVAVYAHSGVPRG